MNNTSSSSAVGSGTNGNSRDKSANLAMGSGAPDAGQSVGVVDQAKQAAQSLIGQTREQIDTQLSSGKEQLADGAHRVAGVIRGAGEIMGGNEYTANAAEQVERLTDYFRNRRVAEIIGDVNAFGRREPVLFLGGSFALGFFGARFLKASGRHVSEKVADSSKSGAHQGAMQKAPVPTVSPPPRTLGAAVSSTPQAKTAPVYSAPAPSIPSAVSATPKPGATPPSTNATPSTSTPLPYSPASLPAAPGAHGSAPPPAMNAGIGAKSPTMNPPPNPTPGLPPASPSVSSSPNNKAGGAGT